MAKNALPSTTDTPKRKRKRMMSDAEVITILICFHFNSYRNFKHYYLGCVRIHWKHLFPQTFSYNRFVEVMPRCFVAMTMFLRLACFGECTGISFVDSTCIPVHTQQTPVQHEGIQGYCCQREEYDGMVCRLQTASAM